MGTEAERPPKRTNCWLAEDLVTMAKIVGAADGETLTEVIEAELRGPLTRRFKRVVAKQHADLGGES
jgi:hypothetical protein